MRQTAIARAQQRSGVAGARVRLLDAEGRLVQHRAVEYTGAVSLSGGYITNVVQTQVQSEVDRLGPTAAPTTRRPAFYNALEGRVDIDFWGAGEEPQQLSFQVLGQHYYSLDKNIPLPDDGTLLGLYTGGFRLGKSTNLGLQLFSSVQTLNSARQQDGPLVSGQLLGQALSQQRTYTLSSLASQLRQEITPTVNYVHAASVTASTTISDAPTELADRSLLFHRGLDYLQFVTSGTVIKDFGPSVRGLFELEYEGNYNNFFLDFTRDPPVRRGDYSIHIVRPSVGLTYYANENLSLTGRLGTALATPQSRSLPPPAPLEDGIPVQDPEGDRSLIFSPAATGELLYQKPNFLMQATAGYNYGSFNPRLGYGRTLSSELQVSGVPFAADRNLKRIAVLFTSSLSRSIVTVNGSLATAIQRPDLIGDQARLQFLGASALVRYGVTNWLGLVAGYSARYVTFQLTDFEPPPPPQPGDLPGELERRRDLQPEVVRQQFFIGVSGYFTTDTAEPPPLTVFAPPRPSG